MALNSIVFATLVGTLQILGLVLLLRRLRGRPLLRRFLAGLFLLANLPWLFFHRAIENPFLLGGWVTPWIVRPSLTWQFGSLLILLVIGIYSLVVFVAYRFPRWLIRGKRVGLDPVPALKVRPREASALSDQESPAVEVSRRQVLGRAVATAAWGSVAVGVGFGLGRAGWPPLVAQHDLALLNLPPAARGLTIAHLTDLHVGPWISTEQMAQALAITRDLKPDLVLFTGDLVDVSPRFCELLTRHLPLLAKVPLGVYGVTGNHDVYTGVDAVVSAMEAAGMIMLRNRHVSLSERGVPLTLVGIDDTGRSWMSSGGAPSLNLALRGRPQDETAILLAHRPTAFADAQRAGLALTVCGHTHGGQFGIPGGPNLADLAYQHTHGVYREGGQLLHVCAGIGAVGLPFRLGVPAEIGLLRLVEMTSDRVSSSC